MRRALLAFLLFIAGCSAVINPDEGLLGDPIDGGGTAVDAGLPDTGIVLRLDSGRPIPDAGPREDAGPPRECTDPSPRCEGDVRIRCEGGFEVRTDCRGTGSYCAAGACQAWVCTPGERGCSADGSAAVACSARGDRLERTPCDGSSCDPDTGTCADVPPPTCDGLPTLALRSPVSFDLCDYDDETTVSPMEDCPSSTRADSGDRVYRLEITETGTYRIQLRDIDDGRTIDTVVSIRRVCSDRSTQLACADDSECIDLLPGGSCVDGVALGRSDLRIELEPGVYYVVADAYRYSRGDAEYRCGEVRLEAERVIFGG